MVEGEESGRLTRPLLIAGMGLVLVAIAVGLNFLRLDQEAPPVTLQESAGPVVPAPEPPPAAGSEAPPARAGSEVPTFDVVRINPKGDAVIAGRARPGAKVIIRDRGQVLGEVTADDRGEWVFLPDRTLPPGNSELILESTDSLGRPVESEDTVVLVVPERGKDIGGRSDTAAQPLALKVPRDGSRPSRVLQAPAAGIQGPRGLAIDTLDYDDSGHLALGGRAQPGDTLLIYLNDRFLGRTESDDRGRWDLVPDTAIEPGLYTLRVDAVDESGKVLARVQTPFSRAQPLDALPGEAFLIVQPGNSLWRLARRTYGSGWAYTLLFDANREQITDPDLIYPGQIFAVPEGFQ